MHDRRQSESTNMHDKLDVEKLLATLSEDDREILRLRYIADLPTADIAKILHLNFVTARVRIHRAIAHARAATMSQTL